jgi:hypothetical protein
MKIDRVILTSNNNPNYYPFWNLVSKIYLEVFNIKPTLIWFSEERYLTDLNISDKYGDIIVQKPHPNFQVPWQTTWGLFYFTKFFKNEICLTIGIDEIPLSSLFIKDLILDIDDNKYVTLIDDAYNTHWSLEKGVSPSAYHIAKGSTFNDIYKFETDFFSEVEKVYKSGDAFWSNGEDKWGIDESYSSNKMRNYKNSETIKSLGKFDLLRSRRIDCYRNLEPQYDIELLLKGFYSEIHLCRPYDNHKKYIDKLVDDLLKIKIL